MCHAATRLIPEHASLSTPLIQDILTALDAFEQVAARVLILRAAAGVRVWSAGHDVRELPEDGHDPLA